MDAHASVIGFFFQAEDGIRDRDVTGVQTCALPISSGRAATVTHRRFARMLDSWSNRTPPGAGGRSANGPRAPCRRITKIGDPAKRSARSRNSFAASRSEEHTSELQSHHDLVCRLLL